MESRLVADLLRSCLVTQLARWSSSRRLPQFQYGQTRAPWVLNFWFKLNSIIGEAAIRSITDVGVHSRADDLIPYEHSVRNAAAARQLEAHLVFDGYGHNDLVAGEGPKIVEAISKLLHKD